LAIELATDPFERKLCRELRNIAVEGSELRADTIDVNRRSKAPQRLEASSFKSGYPIAIPTSSTITTRSHFIAGAVAAVSAGFR
jgi:hypothetical protein